MKKLNTCVYSMCQHWKVAGSLMVTYTESSHLVIMALLNQVTA
jgi:hypothetical protein